MLCAARQFAPALAVYEQLSPEDQDRDRIQVLRARIALELGDLDLVEQILQRDFAVVREGETEPTDLWFELWTGRLARQTGRSPDAALRREVERGYPPPQRLDFRVVS